MNAIAASQLGDVLDGKRHWGEPLLGGSLRSATRAYDVDDGGLRSIRIAPIFFYYALSYAESVDSATRFLVEQLEGG